MDGADAILLLNKLRDEGITVLCSVVSFGVNLRLLGKVSKVEVDGAEITSDDGKAAVRIALLADGLGFEYRQAREYPELTLPEGSRDIMALVIVFPDRGMMPCRERAIIVEVPKAERSG
jgi:hypothetical protein